MCAIIGYVSKSSECDVGLLKRLFAESKIRGLHAFGYAFPGEKELVVRKSFTLPGLFYLLEQDKPTRMIGHCRYSTSGDYLDPRNNQPIVRDGRALVFNGVLHMGTKSEMEKAFHVELSTENDGELFLALPENDMLLANGSFAGLEMRSDGKIVARRNTRRPAWLFQTGGARIITSTLDIGLRAGLTEETCLGLAPDWLLKL